VINYKVLRPKGNVFEGAKKALQEQIEREIATQGKLLESGAKKYAGAQGIKDTGGLINSITAVQPSKLSVIVGSPKAYALLNEYGGRITPAQKRAMFARLAERRSRSRDAQGGKGVLVGLDWKPRPYLIPAFKERVDDMKKRLDIIVKGGK
jgi:hypothetical protein